MNKVNVSAARAILVVWMLRAPPLLHVSSLSHVADEPCPSCLSPLAKDPGTVSQGRQKSVSEIVLLPPSSLAQGYPLSG